MLLDPAREDPMNCIQWLPDNPDAPWDKLRWKPFGRDPEKRGATTIAVLGLLRDLPEILSGYVRAHVLLKMERLRDAVASRDSRAADSVWTELEKILVPELPYLAATYDAITWFLEQPALAGARELVGHALPRPGAKGVDPPSTDLEDAPRVRSLPDKLRLQVRAGAWNVREGILALCAHDAWQIDEMVQVLGLGRPYVANCCRALVNENHLTRRTGEDGAVRYERLVVPP
jgi:hypothetical protein